MHFDLVFEKSRSLGIVTGLQLYSKNHYQLIVCLRLYKLNPIESVLLSTLHLLLGLKFITLTSGLHSFFFYKYFK